MSSSNTTPYPSRPSSPPCDPEVIETYRHLFRRRRPPVSQPPVPCLSCAIKNMHCVYYKSDKLCQRCSRNNAEVCIYQRQDLTRPEEPLTHEQMLQLQMEEQQKRAAEPAPRPWLVHEQQQKEAAGPGKPELQCMVYTLDPKLSQDKTRLLEAASAMLEDADVPVYVHGTPLRSGQVSGFALPSWHSNDFQENIENPEYCFRTHVHYFNGIQEEDRAAAAQASRRLGQERRREREEKADVAREKRESDKEEKEKQKKEEETKENEAKAEGTAQQD